MKRHILKQFIFVVLLSCIMTSAEAAGTRYCLVKSASEIVQQAYYIIASNENNVLMGDIQGSNTYFDAVSYDFTQGKDEIAAENLPAGVQVYRLNAKNVLYNVSRKQYVKSKSGSSVTYGGDTASDGTQSTITIDADCNMHLTFSGTNGILYYNVSQSSSSFKTSTSTTTSDTRKSVQLYRRVDTITLPDAGGYGTYYTDMQIKLPEGVKGGVITGVGDENRLAIDWRYDAGKIIYHDTPLILQGVAGKSYDIVPTKPDQVAAPPKDNLLQGQLTDGMAEKGTDADKFYKLSTDENGTLGFYWGAENGGRFNVKANKAYLVIPSDMQYSVKGFSIEDMNDVTGIATPMIDSKEDGMIYSIQGQRLHHPVPGINIINGRKVFKK